ncbi:AAA family ATPase [uncultured Microbacterium sp.]|uniref:AAA family ATPase n=1 Tax=uncultured Microbacterium sp. TaxID=191216 RepID=UPI0025D6AE8F|nr:AAA family ATPase [uncultured Microbacterium sp.]
MIGVEDPLPRRLRRIVVAGVSGVGKTTLARRISGILDIPYTEIDALFHGGNWTPRESFMDDVDAFTRSDAWVTEWHYSAARPLLAERADLLIWLDLPFLTVTLPRVVRRTLRRRVRREELWNGNTEGPLLTFFTDPGHIVRWAWSTRNKYRESVPRLVAEHPQLVIVRLRTRREVEAWVAARLAPFGVPDQA